MNEPRPGIVAVRPLRRADLTHFASWGHYTDPVFRHYDPRALAPDEIDALWSQLTETPGTWAFAGLLDGRFVASLVARDVDLAASRAEVGIMLAPDAVGRGLAPRILRTLAAVLETRGVRRLRLEVAGFNQRAITAYGRAGFRFAGERWGEPEPGIDLASLLASPAAAAVRANVRPRGDGRLQVRIVRMDRPAEPENE